MIIERGVLLRIEHFEQCCRRIAAPVSAEFIHFVEQNHRVHTFSAAHGLNDPARHRTDIRATMPADLRFVPHAAERHAHELAAQRTRDRTRERSLANTRWSDETENRAVHLADLLEYSDVIKNAILHILETVVILVQHLLRTPDIERVFGADVPRQRQHPVEEGAADGRFGTERGHFAQLAHFAPRARQHRLGQLRGDELRIELLHIIAVFVAEFAMNGAQLFLEIKLALILEQRAAHIVLDLAFEAQQLHFACECHRELIVQHAERRRVKQSLPDLKLDAKMRRDQPCLLFVTFGTGYEAHHFIRKSTMQRDVFLKRRHGAARLTCIVVDQPTASSGYGCTFAFRCEPAMA